jgi:hypothetical protein
MSFLHVFSIFFLDFSFLVACALATSVITRCYVDVVCILSKGGQLVVLFSSKQFFLLFTIWFLVLPDCNISFKQAPWFQHPFKFLHSSTCFVQLLVALFHMFIFLWFWIEIQFCSLTSSVAFLMLLFCFLFFFLTNCSLWIRNGNILCWKQGWFHDLNWRFWKCKNH